MRRTHLCVVIDGVGGVHVAAGSVLEAAVGLAEGGEALGAAGEDVAVDGIVEVLGVLEDGDECVLDVLLSVVVVGGEGGAETVDEGGPVGGGGVVVAVGGSAAAKTGAGAVLVEEGGPGGVLVPVVVGHAGDGQGQFRLRPEYSQGHARLAATLLSSRLSFSPSAHAHHERSSPQTVYV